MKMKDLRQLPFETTLMGVARGVCEHYGMDVPVPVLFGGSGHAFLMNIHRELCPSGPYCWDPKGLDRLLPNLGLRRRSLGFFGPHSTPEEREGVESLVRGHMEEGRPCSILNMENQLIIGFDRRGFDTARPWPGMEFPPARLSFGSWEELGDEVHIGFYVWERCDPAPFPELLMKSLDFALSLYSHPSSRAWEDYSMGMESWEAWIRGVEAGYGDGHGCWWNAMVWGECRLMAGRYMAEASLRLGGMHPELLELTGEYTMLGTGIRMAGDRSMPVGKKIELLRELRGMESRCFGGLRKLQEAFR